MHRKTLAVTLCAFAFAAPAAASIKVATYTGTVYGSYDSTGLFGPAASTLDGLRFVTKYVYDTSLGTRYTDPSFE